MQRNSIDLCIVVFFFSLQDYTFKIIPIIKYDPEPKQFP